MSKPVADGLELKVSVQDSGIGIAEENQESIFSAFSQADLSTTRSYGGTGLGLHISSLLVRMMGGWYRRNTFFSGEAWAHPVDLKLPNPWNLYDMHGNAWEWVQDWSALYEDGPQVDSKGPDAGTYRIVRGGIFMGDAVGLRTAFRYGGSQDFPDGGVGARLVRQDPTRQPVQSSSWGRVKVDDIR